MHLSALNKHEGISWEEARIQQPDDRDDREFIQFIKKSNAKQWPSWKYWVEKTQGWNHMVWRCGFEFWYKCGGKYRAWPWRGFGRETNVFDIPSLPRQLPVVKEKKWNYSSRYQEVEIDGWKGKIDMRAYESMMF